MDRTLELEIVDELLDVLAKQTVELTDSILEEPVAAYTDPELWNLERERLFQRGPVIAALSGELPEPGCWKVFDETGLPVVLVRGDDGVVRGFLNVCAHRGARVVEEPTGQGRRLTCPFHGWSYNTDGTLGGIPHAKTFAGACLEDRTLRQVEAVERHGLIWVVARPGDSPVDVDTYLGSFAGELQRWDIANWRPVETRVHRIAANWKIVADTFTEGYHIPVLHKDSIGPLIAGGLNAYRAWGDHQREVFAMRNLEELRSVDRAEWNAFTDGRIIFTYDIYPNTIIQVSGDHVETYRIFPGEEVGTSLCVHSFFSFGPVESDEQLEYFRTTFDFFFDLVGKEDFRIAAGVQKGLTTGAYDTCLYGKMEPATQVWHSGFRRDVDAFKGA